MTYVNSYPLFVTTTQPCKITTSLFGGIPRRVNVLSPIGSNQLVLNRSTVFSVESRVDCKLIINCPLAVFRIEVYDPDGNVLPNGLLDAGAGSLPNTDYVLIENMLKNKHYYIHWIPLIVNTENVLLFSLAIQVTPKVSDFFTSGFQISNNLPAGITSLPQPDGSVLFQFTNVAVTLGMNIILAALNNAKTVGTLIIQSSDTTTFPNITQNFNSMNNIYVVANGIRNTLFTGTLLATLFGVGIMSNVSVFPIQNEVSAFSFQTAQNTNNPTNESDANSLPFITESD